MIKIKDKEHKWRKSGSDSKLRVVDNNALKTCPAWEWRLGASSNPTPILLLIQWWSLGRIHQCQRKYNFKIYSGTNCAGSDYQEPNLPRTLTILLLLKINFFLIQLNLTLKKSPSWKSRWNWEHKKSRESPAASSGGSCLFKGGPLRLPLISSRRRPQTLSDSKLILFLI